MAHDRVGNEIKEGQLVMVKVDDHLIARVVKITEPRITRIRGAFKGPNEQQEPGVIKLLIDIDQLFAVDQRVTAITCVVDPAPPEEPGTRIHEA